MKKVEKNQRMLITVLMTAVICGLETDSVTASTAAAAVDRRDAMMRVPTMKRTRRYVNALDDPTIFTNKLFDIPSHKHNSFLKRRIRDDGPNFFRGDNWPINSLLSRTGTDLREEDADQISLLNQPAVTRQRMLFETHPIWNNIDRSTKRHEMKPEWWLTDSGELDERPDSSYLDNEQEFDEERPYLMHGSRESFPEPEEKEVRKRSAQKLWRQFRSLQDQNRGDYLLQLKRQPPPGFHAIRGKRNSRNGEDEDEQATIEWIQELAQNLRNS